MEFLEVVLDHVQDFARVFQQVFQRCNLLDELFVLKLDLLPFKSRQAAKLHIEDGLGLDFGELESLYESLPGRIGVGGAADRIDDLVQILQSDAQAFQDMGAVFGTCQLEFATAPDDLLTMIDVKLE